MIYRLRNKTGLDFELPSEAQWEFAARAGNGSTKWGDGSGIQNTDEDANMNQLGRYKYTGGLINGTTEPDQSCGATNGTAIVGSYKSNDWGLYDMHGNVWEICLDYYADDITAHNGKVNIDPLNPSKDLSGTQRSDIVKKGGAYNSNAGMCRAACRQTHVKSSASQYANAQTGFRVVCTAGLQ